MSLFGFFSDKPFPYMDKIYNFLHILGNAYQRQARMSAQGFVSIILAAGIISMFIYNSLICIFHTVQIKTHDALNVFGRCSLGYLSCNKLW